MKKIRIGQVGTLHDHSSMTMLSIRKMSDIYEVVGYVPESEEQYLKIKDSKAFQGLHAMTIEELLAAGIDAAVIEGFEKRLVPDAMMCVKRGVHVHIDKPAGEDIDEFKKLLDLAKENDLVVQMGYMYRYNPAVKKAMEIVKSGRLGEIYSVETHMNCLHPLEKQKWLGQFKGGMMFFLGCHLIDLIVQFQGVPESIVPLNKEVGKVDGAENFGMSILNYQNGVSFAKSTAVEANGFYRRQLVICGTNGTIEINPLEKFTKDPANTMLASDMYVCFNDDAVDWSDRKTKVDIPDYDRYDSMLAEFAECVRGEKQNPYTYEYEFELHKLILKACGM